MKRVRNAALIGVAVVGLACSTDAASRDPAQPPAPRQSTPAQKAPPQQKRPVVLGSPEHGAATKAFIDRIAEYRTFHNNVQKMVPALKETPSPEEIAAREKALGEQLVKTRPHAKQGDFFIPQYQPYLAKIVKDDFAKRSLADRKALIQELPKGMKFGINMPYPTTLPLMTFPANLLKALPELPEELEYRIVGRHLILRDVKANVIVDYMPDVFPIPM
jgi:hypothetical protein